MLPQTSDIGSAVLVGIGFFVLLQGLSYAIKPDISGRFHRSSPESIRRIGFGMMAVGGLLLYLAFRWWA